MKSQGQTGTFRDLDALGASGQPMFVWQPQDLSIPWANAAGLALWRAGSLAELASRRFDRAMPATASLHRLCEQLSGGTEDRGTFVFWLPGGSLSLTCACRLIQSAKSQPALLLKVIAQGTQDAILPAPVNGHAQGQPKTPSPALAAKDAATLAEIARLIRQQTAGGPPAAPPVSQPASLSDDLERHDIAVALPQLAPGEPEFLGRLSHELRTPLTAIIGYGELLQAEQSGPLGNDKYRAYTGDLLEAARHCLSLVNDLVDMTRLAAGDKALEFSEVDINAQVRACLGIVAPLASAAGVALADNLAADLPLAILDRRGLRQILLNLLANAIKFTPPSGAIAISTRYDTGIGVTVIVADTGPGMAGAALDAARGVGSSATGLGLPISRAIAQANGATLDVTSTQGSGTSVSLFLPMSRLLIR